MTEPAMNCVACADLGEWSGGRLVRLFVPPVDLGHDSDAHRIYNVLARNDIRTSEDLAARTDPELLKLRGFGVGMLARVRVTVPSPAAGESVRDADEPLGRLNRALSDLGMPEAALTVTTGRTLSGWPEAVVRLVHAGDPDAAYGFYGEIRIPLKVEAKDA